MLMPVTFLQKSALSCGISRNGGNLSAAGRHTDIKNPHKIAINWLLMKKRPRPSGAFCMEDGKIKLPWHHRQIGSGRDPLPRRLPLSRKYRGRQPVSRGGLACGNHPADIKKPRLLGAYGAGEEERRFVSRPTIQGPSAKRMGCYKKYPSGYY